MGFEDKEYDIPDFLSLPDQVVDGEMKETKIRNEIQKLPVKFREVVILRDIKDFSYEEISETMGRSTASVRSLLFRAKQSLQKKLKNPRLFQPPRV